MSSVSEELESTATSAATDVTHLCPSCGSTGLIKCVKFDDIGMVLAVTDGGETVAEVIRKDGGRGELRVLLGDSFLDGGYRVHLVDVDGEREAFMLLVKVREHDGTIVSAEKF